MTKPTFSIIIPTFNRAHTILRALKSLINQTYAPGLFEIIIVDDGSTDQTQEILQRFEVRGPVSIVHVFKENRGRIAARNKGLDFATKEWICWLDSDDEYVSTYLEVFARAITENPDTKIFTGGTVVYNEKTLQSSLRDAFMPGVRQDGRGCDKFKSGRVSTGGFVFEARLGRAVGFLPEAATPYGDSNSFSAVATQKWPELAALYGQNEQKQWLPFGNPWGDDWLMFYLLTRENIPVAINYHPYLQHIRQN